MKMQEEKIYGTSCIWYKSKGTYNVSICERIVTHSQKLRFRVVEFE